MTSGAAGRTIARIKGAGIQFFQEGAAGISRDTSRSAPYNVFADLTTIAEDGQDRRGAARTTTCPGARRRTSRAARRPRRSRASFGGGHTTNWTYDGKGYVNENTYAAEGDHFPADTVLVLRVQVGDAGYLDPAGNPVPGDQAHRQGPGDDLPRRQAGPRHLDKADLDAPIKLSTKAGDLTVPAGHTWIELVPAATGNVTFTKQ